METVESLNRKILAITLKIQELHPELSPFINEMPVTIPTDAKPKIDNRILREYCDSLNKILTDYEIDHHE